MISEQLLTADASTIAHSIRTGKIRCQRLVEKIYSRIEHLDQRYNSFRLLTRQRALSEAQQIDILVKQGKPLPPLAGVPYAVKNLFDIAGEVTLAGSKINADNPPASVDAQLIQSMSQAGGILIGALNMDEYAYGFTTENTHYGPTRNPHDPTRSAGGSSGGCGAAVAAGFVPLSLGSDTNGSVRVPSSMCGIYGFKPTYGNLSLSGMYPFVHSFDHAGIFARSVSDLNTCYQAIAPKANVISTYPQVNHLKIAIAKDYFEQGSDQANQAVNTIADTLNVSQRISLPEVSRARSAAYLITAMEGGALHLNHLRQRAADLDPNTYPRLLAGALAPAHWYIEAQRFRRWFYEQMMSIFETVDIILAPATPCAAPLINQKTIHFNGTEVPTRPNIGVFTQPISFIGLPVVTVPIQHPRGLPIGVQIIAAPWREADALSVANYLESHRITHAPVVTY